MTTFAPAGTAQLERRLEAALTRGERFRIGLQLGSALLAVGLLLVAFLQQWFGSPAQRPLTELLKCAAALLVSAPIFVTAMRGIFTREADDLIEQLVALAVLAALMSGEFTTAALVPLILNVGHFLEQRSILGAQAAIEGLQTLNARKATLKTAGGKVRSSRHRFVPTTSLWCGPGTCCRPTASSARGLPPSISRRSPAKSLAEEVGPGMRLFAGSVNLTGLLEVTVTGVGEKTALGRVLDLLRAAEQSKTPAVRLLEQYAGYYVPIILMVAAGVLFVTRDMSRAVAVLVVACPGAFVLAGPTAMVAALAAASRLGILIKNTKFLEVLADVDTVVLDKTGTLTLGRLEVVASQPFEGASEEELLRAAACCAVGSRHPVSRAVQRAADAAGLLATEAVESVEEKPGRGVVAVVGGRRFLLGRPDCLGERGLIVPEGPEHAGAVVWVGRDDRVLGCLLLADLPRPEAGQAVSELRELGLDRVVLLTGDRRQVALQVAETLHIEHVIAEVLPEQKLQTVQGEKAAGRSVMVVGDGVNDALAPGERRRGRGHGRDGLRRGAQERRCGADDQRPDVACRWPSASPGARGRRSTRTSSSGPARR